MPRQTTFKATVKLDRFAEKQHGTSYFPGKEMSLSQSCAHLKYSLESPLYKNTFSQTNEKNNQLIFNKKGVN